MVEIESNNGDDSSGRWEKIQNRSREYLERIFGDSSWNIDNDED